ncbi:MAG: 4-hydroxythreonine-4-phosphate dehydrogenase PdxA [Bacteroidales bacterium]
MGFDKKIRVGISQGDINGIGYEVILKTLSDNRILELCTPVIYGSSKVAIYHRKALELPNIPFNSIKSADKAVEDANNMVEIMEENPKVELGVKSEYAGKSALTSLQRATQDLKDGLLDVLVTAPINKHAMQSEEFTFPGHTEYLESTIGDGAKSLMILFNERLRVALVTTHTPIAKLSVEITEEQILEKLAIFDDSLKRDFGIVKPKIAVLSLNPHAGEDGLLGDEESKVITPAINKAYSGRKICCFGPFAADGFFGSGQYKNFDGVLAMYHDQGLAPFKTIAMESGVNFTAGLPFVRTSPDHGTGFDIAGKGEALEDSFREAIYAAIDIFRNRKTYIRMNKYPLRKQYFDKGSDNVVLDLTKIEDSEN